MVHFVTDFVDGDEAADDVVQTYKKHLAETLQDAAETLSLRTIKGVQVENVLVEEIKAAWPSSPCRPPSRSPCTSSSISATRGMRDHAHTLSDFRVPSLSIECEPRGWRGRYNVARLIEKYGDAKLPELRHVLANCPKARSFSVYDQCKVVYGKDSLSSTPGTLRE